MWIFNIYSQTDREKATFFVFLPCDYLPIFLFSSVFSVLWVNTRKKNVRVEYSWYRMFFPSRLPFPLGAFIHLVRARQKDRDQTKTDEGGKKRWKGGDRGLKKGKSYLWLTLVTEIAKLSLSVQQKEKRQKFRSSRPMDSLLCDMCAAAAQPPLTRKEY